MGQYQDECRSDADQPGTVNAAGRGARALRALLLCLATWGGVAQAQEALPARRIALLIGIGEYQSPNVPPLHGPANDVAAMRDVLTRRLSVAPADIESLVDRAATRAAILAAMGRLKQRSRAGDEVIIYASAHGTSAYAPQLRDAVAVPHGSGALVAHDWNANGTSPNTGLVVGRTDILPVFKELEESGRRVWYISDSCYSANQVRSVRAGTSGAVSNRHLPRPNAEKVDLAQAGAGRKPPPPYPYRNVSSLSASAEGEPAADIDHKIIDRKPTRDGKPHGAFTDALLRVLEGELFADFDGDGIIDQAELHGAIAQFMSQRGYGHQPQRLPALHEDAAGLARWAVMRSKAAGDSSGAARPEAVASPLRIAAPTLPQEYAQSIRTLGGIEIVAEGAAGADLHLSPSSKFPDRWDLRTPSGDFIESIPRAALNDAARGLLAQQAWAKKMRQLALTGRRGLLPAEVVPAHFGGTFVIGEQIAFSVKPGTPAHLLLLNVDAAGRVSVLYPASSAELSPVAAGRAHLIPGAPQVQGIRVTEPEGVDQQILIAFDRSQPELARLSGLANVSAGDARLREIEALLARARGEFVANFSELRVVKPPIK